MASSVTITPSDTGTLLQVVPARPSILAMLTSLILAGLLWFIVYGFFSAFWPAGSLFAHAFFVANLVRVVFIYGQDIRDRRRVEITIGPKGIEASGTSYAKDDIAEVTIAMRGITFIPRVNTSTSWRYSSTQNLERDLFGLGLGLFLWPLRRQALRSHGIILVGKGDLGRVVLAYGLDGPTAANAVKTICEVLARATDDSVGAAENEDDGTADLVCGVIGAAIDGIAAMI